MDKIFLFRVEQRGASQQIGNDLGLDISEIVCNKISENDKKYPAEKAYGKADKYTAYAFGENGGKFE